MKVALTAPPRRIRRRFAAVARTGPPYWMSRYGRLWHRTRWIAWFRTSHYKKPGDYLVGAFCGAQDYSSLVHPKFTANPEGAICNRCGCVPEAL